MRFTRHKYPISRDSRRIAAETRLNIWLSVVGNVKLLILVFKLRFSMLRSSADLQLYDSEFQTEGFRLHVR